MNIQLSAFNAPARAAKSVMPLTLPAYFGALGAERNIITRLLTGRSSLYDAAVTAADYLYSRFDLKPAAAPGVMADSAPARPQS